MVTVECDNCGEEFNKRPSTIGEHNFCSRKCQGEWRSKNKSGKNNPNYKEEGDVKCDYCGKEFHKKASHIKKHNFCSKECKDNYTSENPKEMGSDGDRLPTLKGRNHPRHKEKVDIECAYCGKKFKVRPSRKNSARFCSKECYYEWRSNHKELCKKNLTQVGKKLYGDNNPNWRGGIAHTISYGAKWHQQRDKALKRDNHTCQRCGKTKEEMDEEPDVHHIKPLKEFKDEDGNIDFKEANKLSNLITLCRSCHGIIENLPVTIER